MGVVKGTASHLNPIHIASGSKKMLLTIIVRLKIKSKGDVQSLGVPQQMITSSQEKPVDSIQHSTVRP